MSVSTPFSLALIGAGRIGEFHAVALRDSSEVRITTVVEPRDELPPVLRDAGVAHLRSVADLVEHGSVDGALVAVPTVHHGTVVAALAEAGVPILCEKPVGLDADSARAVGDAARRYGVTLRVAFWRRFVPELAHLRARIADGEFGTLSFLSSCQWDHEPPSAQFLDPASSGGMVVDCGVHDFDLLHWLTGQEVMSATGLPATVWSIPAVPGDAETLTLSLRLSGGAVAAVSMGRRHPPGEFQALQVVGTQDGHYEAFVTSDDSPTIAAAFRALVEDFAGHVSDGKPTTTGSIEDAVAALEAAALARAGMARAEAGE